MDAERLEIYPAALEEIRSSVLWYRQRRQTAARAFVEEIDFAIDCILD